MYVWLCMCVYIHTRTTIHTLCLGFPFPCSSPESSIVETSKKAEMVLFVFVFNLYNSGTQQAVSYLQAFSVCIFRNTPTIGIILKCNTSELRQPTGRQEEV